jgi:hypothetical protein
MISELEISELETILEVEITEVEMIPELEISEVEMISKLQEAVKTDPTQRNRDVMVD